MAAYLREERSAPLADDGSSHLLLEVARTVRDNFHILCGLSCIFLLVALPWVVLATVTSWAVAWLPLVLTTAPLWVVFVASAQGMLDGDAVSWRMMAKDLRRLWWLGLRIGILPGLCGTVLLGIVQSASDPIWKGMLLPVMAGVSVAVWVLVIPAVPLLTRLNIAGIALWQASAVVVMRRPAQMLGTVVLAGIGVWLALVFGPAVL
ncbi:MAG TPA: hypothetical protein VEW66_04530, partial [Thermomicrobiales bacterium]|nr:hypothetical protein [Thermomicrobiales bacterium]